MSGCELAFKDICVKIDKKNILKDVSGLAKPGEMMAIMGPSGKRTKCPYKLSITLRNFCMSAGKKR